VTSGIQIERVIFKGKDKGKYKQEKNEANDKGNKHTVYTVSQKVYHPTTSDNFNIG